MPILRLNAGPAGLSLHHSPASALPALRRAAAQGTGPVIILIHGFKYDPACPAHCPHRTLFAPLWQGGSWLGPLGFGAGDRDEGLALAFGWQARGGLRRAARTAKVAARQLVTAIQAVRAHAPQRPVHVIAHSLGSEVIFAALAQLAAHDLDRIVTLTGASYVSRARAAMTTPCGRTAELFNVTSRENDAFDFLFERMLPRPEAGDRAMGCGLDLPNAVTIQLDCPETLAALAQVGTLIAPPARLVCHWSSYTRAGAMAFYARALRRTEDVPLAMLKAALPKDVAPRWSRVFAWPKARALDTQTGAAAY